jgi:hypothetical protein
MELWDKLSEGIKSELFCSLALHITLLLSLAALPFIGGKVYKSMNDNQPIPIILDLSKITITDETNMPSLQGSMVEEVAPKSDDSTSSTTMQMDGKTSEKLNGLIEDLVTPKNKPEPKKETSTQTPSKVGEVQDLLKSLDKPQAQSSKQAPAGSGVVERSELSDVPGFSDAAKNFRGALTLSQIDALRIKLRNCWNLDPGVKDIETMIVVIKLKLTIDGKVEKLEFEDKDRYENDKVFKSVADSARRAVMVCQPFDLPKNKYYDWKDATFTFNPKMGSIE